MSKSTSAQMNFQTSMLFLLFSTLGKSQKKFVSRNTFLNLRYSQKLTDSLKEFFGKKKNMKKITAVYLIKKLKTTQASIQCCR